ncbi:MAG: GIY-YIG nuclease family protein [Elusimicrobia bacterium]|nr:GIY-YIG nuclease family protein [Elusimicrobiota bacterium]
MTKSRPAAELSAKDWAVYVVRCRDGSLYTGITKDVKARVAKHNAGKGGAYTRSRKPVRLRYKETGFTRSQALVREAEIKRLPHELKKELIRA